jgi:hypothetical protein
LEEENIRLSEYSQQYINNIKKLSLVNQVYASPVPPSLEKKHASAGSLIALPDLTIDPSDYEQLENFKDIADNILPGVYLKKRKNIWQLEIFDPTNGVMLENQGTVLLDGVPFTNLEFVADIPINTIKKIDVYKSHIIYGHLDFYGIIAIYTHEKSLPQNYINAEIRTFSNPVVLRKCDTVLCAVKDNLRIPNFQRLIYWNPEIRLTGEKSEVELELSASELTGNYTIRLEGVSNQGIPFSFQKPLIIRK